MRILYFTFFVFLWSLTGKSHAQTPYSDVDQNDLLRKNNITKMLLFKSYVPDGIVKDSILKESVHFKYKDGHFSEQEYFDEKNQLRFRYNFLYNEKHQLILLISELGGPVHPAASFIEPIKIYQYDYDSQGKEIRNYEYNKDTTWLKIETKYYDNSGRLIQIKTKFNRDKEFTSRKYYYNNDGKLEKEEAYFQKRKRLAYSYTHLYDKMMHKESIIFENDSGTELEEEIFYNEDDKIIRIVHPVKNSLYSNMVYYNITEYHYYSNGLLFEKKSESAVERYYYLSGHDDQH